MRIYLDKQVFSNLFKAEKEEYKLLLKKILNDNSNIYIYSNGHLQDLLSDKTEIKYQELDFMESIVKDNYLAYYENLKYTGCYLVRPLEAFQEAEENHIDFSDFDLMAAFDELDSNDFPPDKREIIDSAKDSFLNFELDFGPIDLTAGSDEASKLFKKMFPNGLNKMTMKQWFKEFVLMMQNFENDRSLYKDLRKLSDKAFNAGKFVVEYDEIDFNEDLKDSPLQKSFMDHVNSVLNPDGDKELTSFDFFTGAYLQLDMLGISKDGSKNVRFKNLVNDGLHSYYGAFCDVVISEDIGFRKKTRALYKLLSIDTKLWDLKTFIKNFDLKVKSLSLDRTTFFNLLINDLDNGLVVQTKKSLNFNRTTQTIKASHVYFGHFNKIDAFVEDGQPYFHLYNSNRNYSNFSFFREIEQVVNNAVQILGNDIDLKGSFDWDKELLEIREKRWKGRSWKLNNLSLLLEINEGTKYLALLIWFENKSQIS